MNSILSSQSYGVQGLLNVSNAQNHQKISGSQLQQFEKNLSAVMAKLDKAASASPEQDGATGNSEINKDKMMKEKIAERLAENGNNIAEAQAYARAETFKALFSEAFEHNGGDAEAAYQHSSATMDLSNEEEFAALQYILREYKDRNEYKQSQGNKELKEEDVEISNVLGDARDTLNKKLSLEDVRKSFREVTL